MNGLKKSSKNQQQIMEDNGMPNLPTVLTEVTLNRNMALWMLLGRTNYLHLALGGRVLHSEMVVNGSE